MEELLKELVALIRTARVYLDLKAQKEGLIPAAKPQVPVEPKKSLGRPRNVEEALPAAPAPVARKSTTIEEAVDGLFPEESKERQAIAQMSEKESLDASYRLAADYITRAGDDKAKKKELTEELRDFIKSSFKVTTLAALKHGERVAFIQWIRSKDSKVEALA